MNATEKNDLRYTVIAAIKDAQQRWTACDWTHEYSKRVDEYTPVYCSGSDYDDCSYCHEANASAKSAIEYGHDAIAALNNDQWIRALDAVKHAERCEEQWGDSPVWGPVLYNIEDACRRITGT